MASDRLTDVQLRAATLCNGHRPNQGFCREEAKMAAGPVSRSWRDGTQKRRHVCRRGRSNAAQSRRGLRRRPMKSTYVVTAAGLAAGFAIAAAVLRGPDPELATTPAASAAAYFDRDAAAEDRIRALEEAVAL